MEGAQGRSDAGGRGAGGDAVWELGGGAGRGVGLGGGGRGVSGGVGGEEGDGGEKSG